MINTPMHPVVHSQLTDILCKHFEASPTQAAKLATKLIKTLRQYDLDVVRGNWMEMEQQQTKRGPMTWETLAHGADELVKERNGIKPWMPPELQ